MNQTTRNFSNLEISCPTYNSILSERDCQSLDSDNSTFAFPSNYDCSAQKATLAASSSHSSRYSSDDGTMTTYANSSISTLAHSVAATVGERSNSCSLSPTMTRYNSSSFPQSPVVVVPEATALTFEHLSNTSSPLQSQRQHLQRDELLTSSSSSTTTLPDPSIHKSQQQQQSQQHQPLDQLLQAAKDCAATPELPKRRIRFLLDTDSDSVYCEYFPAPPPLSAQEKQAVWWQPVEFKLFRRYCKKAAQLARNSDYANDFTKVYDACSAKHITDISEHCHISRTHVRGLEVVVFPALIQARKLVVKGVVKTQDKLPPGMTAEQKQKVLSATSRCLTGRARLLARVYAVGDEEVAKDIAYAFAVQQQEE
jgi:hypothetical protein